MDNRRFHNILFDGTTSHNAKQEIFEGFDCVEFDMEPKSICCFYQGCGEDLITLAVNSIGTHVLSDQDAECQNHIESKLRDLEESGIAQSLTRRGDNWEFTLFDQPKRVFFTTESIERIDFRLRFGVSLAMVFEFNPGSVARERNFWDAVSHRLIPGGYVLGSYGSITDCDRTAFVLDPSGSDVNLCFFRSIGDGFSANSEHSQLKTIAEKAGAIRAKPFEGGVFEVKDETYLCSWVVEGRLFLSKVIKVPLTEFSLGLIWMKDRMCLLRKEA